MLVRIYFTQYVVRYAGKIPAQRARATVEEGAYRMRTGRVSYPEVEPGTILDGVGEYKFDERDGVDVFEPTSVRHMAACASCACVNFNTKLRRASWNSVIKSLGSEVLKALLNDLSPERYMHYVRNQGLKMPEAEVMRAATYWEHEGTYASIVFSQTSIPVVDASCKYNTEHSIVLVVCSIDAVCNEM